MTNVSSVFNLVSLVHLFPLNAVPNNPHLGSKEAYHDHVTTNSKQLTKDLDITLKIHSSLAEYSNALVATVFQQSTLPLAETVEDQVDKFLGVSRVVEGHLGSPFDPLVPRFPLLDRTESSVCEALIN